MIFVDLLRSYSWKYWSLGLLVPISGITVFHYIDGDFWYSAFIAVCVATVVSIPGTIVGMKEMPGAMDKWVKAVERRNLKK